MMGRDPSAEALSDLVKWSLVIFNPSTDSEEEVVIGYTT